MFASLIYFNVLHICERFKPNYKWIECYENSIEKADMRFHRCYKILVKHLRQTANSYHHPSLVAKDQHMLLQFLNSRNWNQKFSKRCDISQQSIQCCCHTFYKISKVLKTHTTVGSIFEFFLHDKKDKLFQQVFLMW